MPGMTANISFEIDAKSEVLRVPTAALRYVPTVEEVAPDDRHYVDMKSDKSTEDESKKRSAAEKAEQAKKRQRRLVWVQDGKYLRAVPVLLGLIENQFAEVLEGDLKDGDVVVTGLKALPAAR
jgi:HlyD family secretion protein